jgi:hypothetical protein
MPARRMGCWIFRRVVRGVVMGPVDAIVAVVWEISRFKVVLGGQSEGQSEEQSCTRRRDGETCQIK